MGHEGTAGPPLADGGEAAGAELLATPIIDLAEGRVVVLLAAQPDPERPGEYVLDATAVPEAPLAAPLRLVLSWQGGRRTVTTSRAGRARVRGIPAPVVGALRSGDREALLLQVKLTSESDAMG